MKAEQMAMNKSIVKARSMIVKFIAKDYNIKQKVLRALTKIRKARLGDRTVAVSLRGKSIPLIEFKGKQTKEGAVAKVRKDKKTVVKGGFEATGKKDKQLFKRKTGKRFPIKQLFGVSTTQLFGSDQAQKELRTTFRNRFIIEFKRAIKHLTSKGKK